MSSADKFHPGFSPESSLMLLSLAGLLARAHPLNLPALRQWYLSVRMFFLYWKSTYSYGNSTGFTPVSLLIPSGEPITPRI
jgi:hypothetical protein